MSTLLQINTGIFGEHSHSIALANEFTAQYLSQNKETDVVIRDLVAEPVPHMDANIVSAFGSEEGNRTLEQDAILARSQALIDELASADVVVLGAPMYNFSIPSQLKAYMDQVARAGVTFKYTETGPVGLLEDKPVYVIAARGGMHQGLESDGQTGLINTFLKFVGFKNIQFIYAEGLSMGNDEQEKAYISARESISGAFA